MNATCNDLDSGQRSNGRCLVGAIRSFRHPAIHVGTLLRLRRIIVDGLSSRRVKGLLLTLCGRLICQRKGPNCKQRIVMVGQRTKDQYDCQLRGACRLVCEAKLRGTKHRNYCRVDSGDLHVNYRLNALGLQRTACVRCRFRFSLNYLRPFFHGDLSFFYYREGKFSHHTAGGRSHRAFLLRRGLYVQPSRLRVWKAVFIR